MIPGAQIDTISLGSDGRIMGSGSVANTLMQSNFNINSLRTNAVLRKDEWSQLDQILIQVARQRLVAVEELVTRGLTFDIGNGLGTTILEWEQVTDMDPADVSMSGITEGERDTLEFNLQSMPLPIIHKDFNINIRKLEASRKVGQPLDMSQAELAVRLVMEATEDMVFNGHATREGTARIFGLLTETNRNTGTLSVNWDTAGTSGESKVDDVIAMMTALTNDNMYGPYGMYVSQAAFHNLSDDYKANSDKTQMQRILEIPDLEFIKASKDVTASSIVMHQLTPDVLDEVIGLEPTIVQWDTQGGMIKHFKVMSIMIPRTRSTITNQSGVAHFSI